VLSSRLRTCPHSDATSGSGFVSFRVRIPTVNPPGSKACRVRSRIANCSPFEVWQDAHFFQKPIVLGNVPANPPCLRLLTVITTFPACAVKLMHTVPGKLAPGLNAPKKPVKEVLNPGIANSQI